MAGLGAIVFGGWIWASSCRSHSCQGYFQMIENAVRAPHPPPKWALDMSIVMCALFIPSWPGGRRGCLIKRCWAPCRRRLRLIRWGRAATPSSRAPSSLSSTAALFPRSTRSSSACSTSPRRPPPSARASSRGAPCQLVAVGWGRVGPPPDRHRHLRRVIIASDVGAARSGRLGKLQAHRVSPNKTVERRGLTYAMAPRRGSRWLLGWRAGPVQTLVLGTVIFVAAVAARSDGERDGATRG